MKSLAAELKARRASLQITQEELAHRSGLGAVFVARIEACINQPSMTAFVALARGLGCSPAALMESVMARQPGGGAR